MSFIVRKKMSEYLIKIINRVIGILKILCWKILYGSRFHSGKMTFFYPGCHLMIEKTGSINIGDNCFFNRDCSMTSLGEINIGNDCIFGTKRIHTPKIRYEKTVEIKLIEKTSEANNDIFSSLSRYLAPSLIA